MWHLVLVLVGLVAQSSASSSVQQPIPAFAWSSDARFGGKNVYRVEPKSTQDVLREIKDPTGDFAAPEVVVVFLVDKLSTSQVPDVVASGNLKSIEEVLLSAASSLVMPSVYSPEESLLGKLIFAGSTVQFLGEHQGKPTEWADRIMKQSPAFHMDMIGNSDIFTNNVTDTIVVPVDLGRADTAIRAFQSHLGGSGTYVCLLTAVAPEKMEVDEIHHTGRRLLTVAAASGGANLTEAQFPTFISCTPDATAGILLGLVLIWVTILAASCTMDIQCPSQMWTHAKLPLKGRVDFG